MPPQAASGLSRAPIPLGIRSAAYERVAAVREPRGDVATESRSLLFRESREDIHTPPPPATERRQVGCGRPSTAAGGGGVWLSTTPIDVSSPSFLYRRGSHEVTVVVLDYRIWNLALS